MSSFLVPDTELESATRTKGEQLWALIDHLSPPELSSKKGAYARLMEWLMQDPVFKTQLFRSADVLPSLDSPAEIVRHLQEYLGDKTVELHPALKAGPAASSFAPALVTASRMSIPQLTSVCPAKAGCGERNSNPLSCFEF